MKRALCALLLLASCTSTPEVWEPEKTQWKVELGMTLDELQAVWPGGAGWEVREGERELTALWLYSVLQPVFMEDGRVVGFGIGTTWRRDKELMHPMLEGVGVGQYESTVLERLGEPHSRRRFDSDEGRFFELWSYGNDKPRLLFVHYQASEEPSVMALMVGLTD